eukprot:560744-Lingulodinium_polyedra.AAC.1
MITRVALVSFGCRFGVDGMLIWCCSGVVCVLIWAPAQCYVDTARLLLGRCLGWVLLGCCLGATR